MAHPAAPTRIRYPSEQLDQELMFRDGRANGRRDEGR